MKTKNLYITLILMIFGIYSSNAAITHVQSNTTLDANGTNTVTYSIQGGNLNLSHWSFVASGFQMDGQTGNSGYGLKLSTTSSALKELNLNDVIDGTSSYGTGGFQGTTYYSTNLGSPSVIGNGQSTYFGFRIEVGTDYYYGWLKLTKNNDDVVVINEYAYETVANTAINAGQTAAVSTNDIQSSQFSLYPNPFINEFSISGSNHLSSVTIYTTTGKLIKEVTVKDNTGKINISTEELTPGTYFAILSDNNAKRFSVVLNKQ